MAPQFLYGTWDIVVGKPRISMSEIDHFVLLQKRENLSLIIADLKKEKIDK
jgi:hypothetical protein